MTPGPPAQTGTPSPITDPIKVLENTRRTLAKLMANIDAALEANKEPTPTAR